jgi:hypothetical protein
MKSTASLQLTASRSCASGAEYKSLDHTRRFGWEFWKPVLWLLLALVFLEIFLQQRFARAKGSIGRADAGTCGSSPDENCRMNREKVETSLRFVGDWPWWAGLTAALVLGADRLVLVPPRSAAPPRLAAVAAADPARARHRAARADAERAGAASSQDHR